MKPKTEADCLAAIATGEVDAQDLLLTAMPTARRSFNAVDRHLRRFLDEVRVHFPDAIYYTASGGFTLMLGRSHGEHERAQQRLVALSGFASISDGDF